MGGSLIWTSQRGRQAPLGRVSKEGGIPPHPPLFVRGGSNGEDGKARDLAYKRWDRFRLRLSAVSLLNKDGGLCGTVWAA